MNRKNRKLILGETMYVIAGEKLEKLDAVGFPDKKGRVKKVKIK